jgi:hypothetical protein
MKDCKTFTLYDNSVWFDKTYRKNFNALRAVIFLSALPQVEKLIIFGFETKYDLLFEQVLGTLEMRHHLKTIIFLPKANAKGDVLCTVGKSYLAQFKNLDTVVIFASSGNTPLQSPIVNDKQNIIVEYVTVENVASSVSSIPASNRELEKNWKYISMQEILTCHYVKNIMLAQQQTYIKDISTGKVPDISQLQTSYTFWTRVGYHVDDCVVMKISKIKLEGGTMVDNVIIAATSFLKKKSDKFMSGIANVLEFFIDKGYSKYEQSMDVARRMDEKLKGYSWVQVLQSCQESLEPAIKRRKIE